MRVLIAVFTLLLSGVCAVDAKNVSLNEAQPLERGGDCGSFEHGVTISLASPGEPCGWVIQHVVKTLNVSDCDWQTTTSTGNHELNYWEAWRVKDGVVGVPIATTCTDPTPPSTSEAEPNDHFYFPSEPPGSQGAILIRGWMKFVPNYEVKLEPDGPWTLMAEYARNQPSRTTAPEGWTDDDCARHELRSWFNCCGASVLSTGAGVVLVNNGVKNASVRNDAVGSPLESLLRSCPVWTRLGRGNEAERKLIVRHLEDCAKVGTAALRPQIEQFVKLHKLSIQEMSKIFLLNRILFAVPRYVEEQRYRAFGGWAGIPAANGRLDALWPLELSRSGSWFLTGNFAGYYGRGYQALQEFDYFSRTYGPRSGRTGSR